TRPKNKWAQNLPVTHHLVCWVILRKREGEGADWPPQKAAEEELLLVQGDSPCAAPPRSLSRGLPRGHRGGSGFPALDNRVTGRNGPSTVALLRGDPPRPFCAISYGGRRSS